MNYILLSFLFIFSSLQLSAQNFADKEYYLIDSLVLEDLSEYDSLLIEKHLKEYHGDNTYHKLAHLDSIIELCESNLFWRDYNKIYFKESRKYFHQFKVGSPEMKEIELYYTQATFSKALIHNQAKEIDSALYYYDIVLELYKKLEFDQKIGEVMSAMSTLYIYNDRYADGIAMANESLKYLDTNIIQSAVCFNEYALFQKNRSNYEEALFFINKALNISQNLKENKFTILLLANICADSCNSWAK